MSIMTLCLAYLNMVFLLRVNSLSFGKISEVRCKAQRIDKHGFVYHFIRCFAHVCIKLYGNIYSSVPLHFLELFFLYRSFLLSPVQVGEVHKLLVIMIMSNTILILLGDIAERWARLRCSSFLPHCSI